MAHFDEIGLPVAGQTAWVHSASTDRLSLFTVHPSRGHDAITTAGVLPNFAGIAVHDGYTPYRRYGTAHGLCNAHHLRELAGILDADPDQQWAQAMIRLLCITIMQGPSDGRDEPAALPALSEATGNWSTALTKHLGTTITPLTLGNQR